MTSALRCGDGGTGGTFKHWFEHGAARCVCGVMSADPKPAQAVPARKVWDISIVAELRELLASHPDEAQIVVQVIGTDGTAWNMRLKAAHGRDHGFKWQHDPPILTLWHPDLETLPPFHRSALPTERAASEENA